MKLLTDSGMVCLVASFVLCRRWPDASEFVRHSAVCNWPCKLKRPSSSFLVCWRCDCLCFAWPSQRCVCEPLRSYSGTRSGCGRRPIHRNHRIRGHQMLALADHLYPSRALCRRIHWSVLSISMSVYAWNCRCLYCALSLNYWRFVGAGDVGLRSIVDANVMIVVPASMMMNNSNIF